MTKFLPCQSASITKLSERESVKFPHWDGPYHTFKWVHVNTDQAHGTDLKCVCNPQSKAPESFQELGYVRYAPPHDLLVPSFPLGEVDFESFHVHLLVHEGEGQSRQALSRRHLFRMLAPQAQ